MKMINVNLKHFEDLNEEIRTSEDNNIVLHNVYGQRYIAAGLSDKNITVNGTPGNALGCYNDGCEITVNGNAQDATADTMNSGTITVHGGVGDALGYGMRGGRVFIKGNSGYRSGIHMKEYQSQIPLIIIGGRTGSFLGEYQAGGTIIVLNLNGEKITDYATCGTGQHGGRIFLRTNEEPTGLPQQVKCEKADDEMIGRIMPYLQEFKSKFNVTDAIENDTYYILTPNSKNPYKRLYTEN
jgi:glutamate synthase domain-containing protein 3